MPQPVAKAIAEDRKNKDKTVELKVLIDNNRNLQIEEIINGKKKTYSIKSKQKKINLAKAHENFIQLKQKHNMVFSLEVFPADLVSYEEIIKLMDEARMAKADGVNFEVVNKETKEKVKTKFMFPNVTFGNLLEG